MSEEFPVFMAAATLVVSSVGFLAGLLWAIPAAYRDRNQVDPDERGMVIFAGYQLLVAVLSTFSLLCFVTTAILILAFDIAAVPRVLGGRLLGFAAVCAIAALVVGGPVARKRANLGEVTRMRAEEEAREERARMQATATDTNERLKAMQELAVGVRARLETETAAIRDRLEKHDTQMQGDRDQVKDELGVEQSKVRDALGEEQGTVRDRLEQDTNTRIREVQERGQSDQPEERTDRKEGHEHRSDIDARLLADTLKRSQERQDDREERAEERRDEREERAEERREEE